MKSLRVAVILSLFLLPACSSLQAVGAATTGTISSVAPDAMNAAKKGLTAAHLAHEAAADAMAVAAKTGLCHATCAASAKGYLDTSENYLVAADRLVTLGDAPGIESKISAATALISQVQSLVGAK